MIWVLGLLTAFIPGIAEPLEISPEGIRAEDGDTLIVQYQGEAMRVQLNGIDAPEDSDNPKLQQDLQRTGLPNERLLRIGKAATGHLRRLIEDGQGWRLIYAPDQRDRYGRLGGRLLGASGVSAAEAMVSHGYARPLVTRDGSASVEADGLVRQADQAREMGLGLWALDPEAMAAWVGEEKPRSPGG